MDHCEKLKPEIDANLVLIKIIYFSQRGAKERGLTIYIMAESVERVTYNTVPDNYASAKVPFLHPLKIEFRKNPYKPNDRPCLESI